jgi:ankyrin repeat protein
MHLPDINVAERTVNFLLQLGAKPDVKNHEDKTPLFLAAYRGSAPMVRALLNAGANANHTDLGQNTPLFFAKTAEVAAMLLDKGAKINHKSKCVHTALHVAAAFYPSNGDLINLLKTRGADLKAKNKWGHTPLELLQIANMEKKIVIPYVSFPRPFFF